MAPKVPDTFELPEGTRLLDRYRILDRVASGGMAAIYRATDERLDRVVCVKILRTMLVESTNRAVYKASYQHFQKEALALSRLQHPNTLRIYDFGYVELPGDAESQRPFQVSEFLEGGHLERLVKMRGALDLTETLAILDRIAGALTEAHSNGIIHRDIKPSNIIFARLGEDLVPKLADFGIARSSLQKEGELPEAVSESVSAVALFSPRWAAPEQLCGTEEGPQTDVYGLALLAVFMLSGRLLFDDRDIRETFPERVRGDDLVLGRLAQLGFGGEVLRVMHAALSYDSGARLSTPTRFVEELRRAVGAAPASVPKFRSAAPLRATIDESSDAQPSSGSVSSRASVGSLPAPSDSGASDALSERPTHKRSGSKGAAGIRFVTVHEKVDMGFLDTHGGEVRFRIAFLPTRGINIKGLTCFVSRTGGGPAPAIAVSADGALEFVSARSAVLGSLQWFFGENTPEGHVFLAANERLVVPFSEAEDAVLLHLPQTDEWVVLCRAKA